MLKIIITGACGRLGAQMAQTIAKKKCSQCLIGRETHRLQELQQKLDSPHLSHILQADFSRMKDFKKLLKQADQLMGGIDVLINNAAMFGNSAFMSTESTHIDKIIDINFRAALHLTQQAIPYLSASENPKIINISSIAATAPEENLATYSATKAALDAFSKALFKEVSPSGIRVCNLSLDQLQLTKSPTKSSIPTSDISQTLQFLLDYPPLKSFPTAISIQALK